MKGGCIWDSVCRRTPLRRRWVAEDNAIAVDGRSDGHADSVQAHPTFARGVQPAPLPRPAENGHSPVCSGAEQQNAGFQYQGAPRPAGEAKRLELLHSLGVLDSQKEDRFEAITQLLCNIFNVPICLISLVDAGVSPPRAACLHHWRAQRACHEPAPSSCSWPDIASCLHPACRAAVVPVSRGPAECVPDRKGGELLR